MSDDLTYSPWAENRKWSNLYVSPNLASQLEIPNLVVPMIKPKITLKVRRPPESSLYRGIVVPDYNNWRN